jgi:hypothetical protein
VAAATGDQLLAQQREQQIQAVAVVAAALMQVDCLAQQAALVLSSSNT